MTFNAYSATHKTWDHVGNLVPNIEANDNIIRPVGAFKVAPWLPVVRQDKSNEEWFVISAGKALAFDRTGCLVPAGYATMFAVADSAVDLTYTADDVTAGTINLVTGVACTAAITYIHSLIQAGLLARGLIDASEESEAFIGKPIGIAPYSFYQFAGLDPNDPSTFRRHNFNIQPFVSFLANGVIELPMVPLSGGTSTLSSGTGISDSAIVDWTDSGSHGSWFSSTSLGLTTRYSSDVSAGDDVVAFRLPELNIAENTTETPMTFPTVGMSRRVDSIEELTTAGDYYLDLDVGVVLFFEADGNAAPTVTGAFTFYYYDTVATGTESGFAYVTGNVRAGSHVSFDANSNLVLLSDANADTYPTQVMGKVIQVLSYPQDGLELVKTGYASMSSAYDRMPGSASAGLPDAITFAGGSNKIARILLLN
jgi:hypothetical protein